MSASRLWAFVALSACGRTSPYELAAVTAPPPDCRFGALHGSVCSTDGQTKLNGATVSVDAFDCRGTAVHQQTVSGADGSFTLADLPAGFVTVEARLGDFRREQPATVAADRVTELGSGLCLEQRELKIAVVTGNGDKIERLLTGLHLTFTTFDGTSGQWTSHAAVFLADLTQLKAFDLVFIDCDAASTGGYRIELGDEAALIEKNLRLYVEGGGSLYGSDWAALLVGFAAPGALPLVSDAPIAFPFDAHHLAGFAPQTVTAAIADDGLRTFLGKPSIAIKFPRQSNAVSLHWGLLEGAPGATVLARADAVKTCPDAPCDTAGPARDGKPLAVRVKVTPAVERGGWVVYTSFHNIAQTGDDVARMLEYLVLNL